jgi:AcrR family transcriptional regulator
MSAKSPRRRPKQARSKEKVEKILQAAQSILEAEGVAAFNTNRIAKEAGIGVGSLYEYFPNKKAIAEASMARLDQVATDALVAQFSALQEGDTLAHTIASIVDVAFSLYERHSHLYQALRTVTGEARRREGIRPVEAAILDAVTQRLLLHRTEITRENIELASLMVFYSVESLAFAYASHLPKDHSRESWRDECVAMVLRYLTAADG